MDRGNIRGQAEGDMMDMGGIRMWLCVVVSGEYSVCSVLPRNQGRGWEGGRS